MEGDPISREEKKTIKIILTKIPRKDHVDAELAQERERASKAKEVIETEKLEEEKRSAVVQKRITYEQVKPRNIETIRKILVFNSFNSEMIQVVCH